MQKLYLLSLLLALWLWRNAGTSRHILVVVGMVIRPEHLSVQKAQNFRFCD